MKLLNIVRVAEKVLNDMFNLIHELSNGSKLFYCKCISCYFLCWQCECIWYYLECMYTIFVWAM